ncbi:MAG: pilin [bacterium]
MVTKSRILAVVALLAVLVIFPQIGYGTGAGTKKPCAACADSNECKGSLKCVNNSGVVANPGTCGDECVSGTICFRNPACVSTFEELINKVASFIFWVGLGLAPLMILVGAAYIFLAAGDPAKVKTAMHIFLYTGIGLVIIITAKALAAVITGIFK